MCIRDVASLMAINGDPAIRDLHREAAMIAPDGAPIARIGKLRGLPVERTCGPDLIDLVCRRSVDSGLSHFFFGGKPGVAQKLAENFARKYPGIHISGYESPPFRELGEPEDPQVLERIANSGADVIWVGLSSPKQDVWMRDNYRHLPQTLIGVGAAFDFHTGAINRAPRWMREHGLEWAHRLLSEPKRLWHRYLVLAPRFVIAVGIAELRQRI